MGRKKTLIMIYVKKNILQVLTKLFKLKSKKDLRNEVPDFNRQWKNWPVLIKDHVKKNLNMSKPKIRDETPKSCIDSKEI